MAEAVCQPTILRTNVTKTGSATSRQIDFDRGKCVNTNIIPVVVGALGTTRKSPEKNLKRAAAAVSSASSYFRKLHSCTEQHEYSETY